MAYNEEANIGHLLHALLNQQAINYTIGEIIVVASGCTDNTVGVVDAISQENPKVTLIVQPRREGKASAINLFLARARSDILVLESADTIPEPTALEHLLAPFADPEVGMTGARPMPVNDPNTFMGFAAHLMWELHHQIALQHPKLGECVAFRRVFHRIPVQSAVDEVSIQAIIRAQDYKLVYVPEAVVHNRGPDNVSDFLRQRRRIYCGHLKTKHDLGYSVSTMSPSRIMLELVRGWRWGRRQLAWVPAIIGLEAYGRFLGVRDYHSRSQSHTVWETAKTTKTLRS
jgi:cellulose synthase/poly-beta-1,6-N-acetylglucosamine synthase-like glycosyltransferase